MYESSPTQAVVGAFTVQDIHRQEIDQLWKAVGRLTASTREAFNKYFAGVSRGTAVEIEHTYVLDSPCGKEAIKEASLTIPQSYRYVDHDFIDLIGSDLLRSSPFPAGSRSG